MKCNYKLVISYDGTSYAGFQKTKLGPSIQETLEKRLEKILQHPVTLQAASRTDAGVHAEGQVINFFTQKPIATRTLKHSLNALLPKEIAVLSAEEMPLDFHPTLDPIQKEYWYHICNTPVQLPFDRHTSWHFPHPLDVEAMAQAAEHLLGSHDFSTFCNERKLWDRSPHCDLEKVEILPLNGGRLRIVLIGDHFLYRMARNIVGTLVYVGCSKLKAEAIPAILKSKDRTRAGITAPAHGLTLKRVLYANLAQ